MNVLLVALGGGLGAASRYGLGQWVAAPWGTLAVNIIGSFLMGLLIATNPDDTRRLLLGVGFLGGFTTFSAFSLDVVQLAQNGRIGLAGAYVALSVGVSVAALLIGLVVARGVA